MNQKKKVSTVETAGDCGRNWEHAAEIELEVAEALAGLAHSAKSVSGIREERNERERPAKSESSPRDSGQLQPKKSEVSICRSSDPGKDMELTVQQQSEITSAAVMKEFKVEQDAELPKSGSIYSTSYTSFAGSKLRQKLTEQEKEARRIRRVLANRESARQTIRRRQALYEELTRKASSLALENENLKREKELAIKEYDSLKSTNESLKAQMARTLKTEAADDQVYSKPSNAEASTFPTTHCPFLISKATFAPILLHPIIQSSNPVQLQSGSQNEVPKQAIANPCSFQELENPLKLTCPGTSVCILPYPWFAPPPHGSGLHFQPSFDLNDDQNQSCGNNRSSASASASSSAIPITDLEKCPSSLLTKVKTETSSSTETMPVKNLHEVPFRFPKEGDGKQLGPCPNRVVLVPAPVNLVKHDTGKLPDNSPKVQLSCSAVSPGVNSLPESKQDPIVFSSKKKINNVAAREARKRRKEITRLKSLHCHQLRMHF
ncbi:hypothetical protein NMG60_11008434 [Bertholletia excelsa]